MKKTLVVLFAVFALALAGPALADNNADNDCQGGSCNDNGGTIIIGDDNQVGGISGDGNIIGGDGGDANADADATAVAGASSKSSSSMTYNEAENKRELARGHGSAYQLNAPVYNEMADRTGNVQHSQDILQVRKKFTVRMLKALEAREDLDLLVKAYQSKRLDLNHPKKGYKDASGRELNLDAEVEIIVELPKDMSKFNDIAHITVIGDTETTTMGAIAAAAVEAFRHGADTLLVTGEGAVKVLQASGWGVMFGGSASMIAGDTGSAAGGAVIAPGVGYASAKTMYGFSPYLQCFGLQSIKTIEVK